MKILIIEDEADLRETIEESLLKEKYLVESADSFQSGHDKIIRYDYACILLDIGLPGGNGLDLLRTLKEMGRSDNVIIISAKDALDDKIAGLELGADDYLTKPFHLAELHARVRSVVRRSQAQGHKFLEIGNLKLDYESRMIYVRDQALELNRKEYDILAYFMSNANRLVQKSTLAEHVWGDFMDESEDFEFLYSQMKNLRKKLQESDASVEVRSVYGMGYKFQER
jgi:DNA-binding response OmpR family regulator